MIDGNDSDQEGSRRDEDRTREGEPLLAHECAEGHLTYPSHAVCPECGNPQTGTVDLTEELGEVLTWTSVTASPSGVREPNTLALVEFKVDERSVRILGGTTDDVSVGDQVCPVYVEQLRDPGASFRETESQLWGGYRFEPV